MIMLCKQLVYRVHVAMLVIPAFILILIGSANPVLSQAIIMAGSEGGGFTGTNRIVEKTDDIAFNDAINPFSQEKLESYIAKFPDSKYTKIAREICSDEKRIRDIISGDTSGLRYIPIERMGEGLIKSGTLRNAIKGRTTYNAGSSNYTVTSSIGGVMIIMESISEITHIPPCGNGSVLIFKGGDGFIRDLHGFTGSSQNPLRMAYIVGIGLVYLGGQGKNMPQTKLLT